MERNGNSMRIEAQTTRASQLSFSKVFLLTQGNAGLDNLNERIPINAQNRH
ncbi:hypothetical protein PO002_36920 [Cupriavidus necator]|uniref:hypothetical protein n=1 Tax=Cupriavidus necator TaxID=106590 RepID=UPI0039C004CD